MSSSREARDRHEDLEQKMHLLVNCLAEAFRTGLQHSELGARDRHEDLEKKLHVLVNRLGEALRTVAKYSEMVPEHLHSDFVRGMHQEVDRFCEGLRTRHQDRKPDSSPLDEPVGQEAPGQSLQVEDKVVSPEDVQTGAPEPPSKRRRTEDEHQPTTQSQPPAQAQPPAQSLPRTESQPTAQPESPAQALPTAGLQPPARSQLPTESRLAAERVEGLRHRLLSGFSGMMVPLRRAVTQAAALWARGNVPDIEDELLEALWSAFSSLEED